MATLYNNPRGGLIVDRDSLHASPGYARQVEALKQLRERKVNADVEKAVEALKWLAGHTDVRAIDHIVTLRQALRDQDAELARQYECIRSHGIVTRRAEERAEKAEALLRDIKRWDLNQVFDPKPDYLYALPYDLRARITANLGGEHE